MATLTTTGTSGTELELKRSLVPQAWEASVRVIGMSECKAAALALSHAFATDDFVQYLLGAEDMAHLTPEKKWQLHVKMMTYIVAAHCLNGVVTTVGPDYDGVALWMPPGRNMDDWWTIFRSGMWKLNFQLSAEGRKRYYDLALPLLHRTKAEVLGDRDNDSWYLVYIGTKPSARGRGYAKKLIEHMLQRVSSCSITQRHNGNLNVGGL
jgi:GNAT superfamily N-acetyltransferase